MFCLFICSPQFVSFVTSSFLLSLFHYSGIYFNELFFVCCYELWGVNIKGCYNFSTATLLVIIPHYYNTNTTTTTTNSSTTNSTDTAASTATTAGAAIVGYYRPFNGIEQGGIQNFMNASYFEEE